MYCFTIASQATPSGARGTEFTISKNGSKSVYKVVLLFNCILHKPVGQAVALEALEVLVLMLSSTLGVISLKLAPCSAVRRLPGGGARRARGAGAPDQQHAGLDQPGAGTSSQQCAGLPGAGAHARRPRGCARGARGDCINHDKFNKCLSDAVGIGAACSECDAKLLATASRAAKEHVCSDGASPGASRAQPLPKPLCKRALVLLLRQQLHAWSPVPLLALPVNKKPSRTLMPMHWEQPVTSVAIRPSV